LFISLKPKNAIIAVRLFVGSKSELEVYFRDITSTEKTIRLAMSKTIAFHVAEGVTYPEQIGSRTRSGFRSAN
jgi:hypothetical protein